MQPVNHYGLKFHHLGLAVKEPELAARFLAGVGYQIGTVIRDNLQNVNLMLCTHDTMPAVEIIYPTETPGPLAPILKSKTSMIYHVCYESEKWDESLRAMEADKTKVLEISAPQPAILFPGCKASFQAVAGFGLIEVIEPL